jgi:hypothetical protein
VIADDPVTLPRWIGSTLEIKEGRDPLGLQTTTQDRLTPLLLPGVLELSVRARYLSFHAFLLDEYRALSSLSVNIDAATASPYSLQTLVGGWP